MPGPYDANEIFHEQVFAIDIAGPVDPPDSKIDTAGSQLFGDARSRQAANRQPDAWCVVPQPFDQARQIDDLADIREHQVEGSLRAIRRKGGSVMQHVLDRIQRMTERYKYLLGAGRRQHAVTGAYQERIAKL